MKALQSRQGIFYIARPIRTVLKAALPTEQRGIFQIMGKISKRSCGARPDRILGCGIPLAMNETRGVYRNRKKVTTQVI